MKIAIEAQRIFRKDKHGMDFVALETIRELQKLDNDNEYRIYVAPGEDRCLHNTNNFKIIEIKAPNYPIWEQLYLPRAVDSWGADILHCTSNTAPLRLKTPLIITLHDVIFMESDDNTSTMSAHERAGRIYRRLVVPRAAEKSRTIITVSRYEKEQIQMLLNVCPTKIEVVHNGFSRYFAPIKMDEEIAKLYSLPEKFIFFLGNTDPKKNTPRTIEAFAHYLNLCREHNIESQKLVVADLSTATLKKMVRAEVWEKVESMIITPGYIYNYDLPHIYSASSVFLYTSLRESFGIPLLEAMACGTPVISSDTSAIPEVAGQAALLTDPKNAKAIADSILSITTDKTLAEKQISLGLQQVAKYNWRDSAIQILSLYKQIIHTP